MKVMKQLAKLQYNKMMWIRNIIMNKQIDENGMVQCRECLMLIPESVAKTAEGTDYVWYFCGEACYEKWAARNKE